MGKGIRVLAILAVSFCITGVSLAITCQDLDTSEKIRSFSKKAKESNPLFRKYISARLEMRTDDKKKRKKSQVHNLRLDKKKRTYFIKGKDAPLCMVSLDEKDFKCNECTLLTNSQCRSYKQDESSTTIKGTNIDTKDVELVESKDFESKCYPVSRKKNYIKIVSKKVSGDSQYDEIESYYDKKKEINILMNLKSKGTVRKIYKYSPKNFIKIDSEWMSTVSRVRTVRGKWKRYTFETRIKVSKDKGGKLMLHLDPIKDPTLKKMNQDFIFSVN